MGSNKRKYLSLNIIISLCTPLKFSLTPPSPDPTSPHSQSAPSQLLLPSLTQLSPPPTPSEDLVPSPDGTDSVGVDMPVSVMPDTTDGTVSVMDTVSTDGTVSDMPVSDMPDTTVSVSVTEVMDTVSTVSVMPVSPDGTVSVTEVMAGTVSASTMPSEDPKFSSLVTFLKLLFDQPSSIKTIDDDASLKPSILQLFV